MLRTLVLQSAGATPNHPDDRVTNVPFLSRQSMEVGRAARRPWAGINVWLGSSGTIPSLERRRVLHVAANGLAALGTPAPAKGGGNGQDVSAGAGPEAAGARPGTSISRLPILPDSRILR